MKWHCGLLDERPDKSRTLDWITRPSWGHLPDEIERELRIWLAMPGIPHAFHVHTLRHGLFYIKPNLGHYDQWRDEVTENWLSATREDCVKLAQMRPGTGNVPLISQIRAVEDTKTLSVARVAADYRVRPSTIHSWKTKGFNGRGHIPPGFEHLIRQ